MKKYAIFGGICYYARGGFNDFIGTVDTLDEVSSHISKIKDEYVRLLNGPPPEDIFDSPRLSELEWWHVVDMTTGEVVLESEETPHCSSSGDASFYHIKFHKGSLVTEQSLKD